MCRGQVGQARVQAHDQLGMCQGVAGLGHGQKWWHHAVTGPGNVLGALLFLRATPHHGDAHPLLTQLMGHGNPVLFGPEFFWAAGAGDQDRVGSGSGRPGLGVGLKAKVGGGGGQGIAQHLSCQLAAAVYRVKVSGHMGFAAVKQAGQGLTNTVAVVTGAGAFRKAGKQGAFEQALHVDDQVIVVQRHVGSPGFDGRFGVGGLQAFAPLAPLQRDHPVDRPVLAGHGGEAFFHQPIDLDPWDRLGDVGDGGQGVDDIAHRAGFDDQDAHSGIFGLRSWCRALCQAARDVLVQHACNERLIRNAFFQCFDLNVGEVARRQPDVDPAILEGGGPGCRLELGQLALAGDGFQLTFFKGLKKLVLFVINLGGHHRLLGASIPWSLCG